MNNFRVLNADEIELRISTITVKGLTLLLYKTARTDANLLDEVVGAENWQNDFKLINGVLFGGIGIKKNNEWAWKWDCGTESYTEKEKGQASDAFKRAGFKVGIGRELYTAPFVYIPAEKCNIKEKNGKPVCYDKFLIEKITHNEKGEINELIIYNGTTKAKAYSWRNGSTQPTPAAKQADQQTGDFTPQCAACKAKISIAEHDYSVKKFNRPLCRACQKKANAN
jgi:hypothetical protein